MNVAILLIGIISLLVGLVLMAMAGVVDTGLGLAVVGAVLMWIADRMSKAGGPHHA